jgi:hypothetical protein
MATNISLVSGRALIIANPWFPTLTKIADQFWAIVVPQFNSEDRTDEAIEILRNPSASPDMCDWAERYLCGMEGTNEKRYCEGRRWQS